MERVRGPLDYPRAAVDQTDRGAHGGEVEELLRIDVGHLVAAEVAQDQPERRGCGLAGVVPAVEGAHHDRVSELGTALPADGIHPDARYPVRSVADPAGHSSRRRL